MGKQPPSMLKIDQVLQGELPVSVLSPQQRSQMLRLQQHYQALQPRLASYKPVTPPLPTGPLASLKGLWHAYAAVVKAAAVVGVVAAAATYGVKTQILPHTHLFPSAKNQPAPASPKEPKRWALLMAGAQPRSARTTSEVIVERQQLASPLRELSEVRPGDRMQVRMRAAEASPHFTVVALYDGKNLQRLFPQNADLSGPVLMLPEWQMPYRFLFTAEEPQPLVVVLSSPKIDIQMDLNQLWPSLHKKWLEEGQPSSMRLKMAESWMDGHFFTPGGQP